MKTRLRIAVPLLVALAPATVAGVILTGDCNAPLPGNPASTGRGAAQPSLDLRGGVRGRFFKKYRAGTNVVLLDPDVATVFRDSGTVNQTLRLLMDVAKKQVGTVGKKHRAPNKGMQPLAQRARRG